MNPRTYPVEVRGGVSGLSAGQTAVVYKTPYTAHLENVPLVGAKRPSRILNATGLWFVGNNPIGDFQGTDEGGSGGPAVLPLGPTGDGVFGAGRCRSGISGADKFRAETLLTLEVGVTYTLYARKTHEITVTGATWTAATKTLNKTGAFATLTVGVDTTDSTVDVSAGTLAIKTQYGLAEVIDADNITVAVDIGATDGVTDIDFVLYYRTAWQSRVITSPAGTYSTSSEITLASALSAFWSGDTGVLSQDSPYYIVADNASGTENTPESMPTPSAATNQLPWFPYQTFSRNTHLSISGFTGRASVPAAAAGTDMNHYWWGLFSIPPESFVNGDEYTMRIAGDYTHAGINTIIELLLIPNFDPDVDWVKGSTVDSSTRLANKAIVFQSDVISTTGTFPLSIMVRGKASARQTSAGNPFAHNWDCDIRLGGAANTNGGGGCAAMTINTTRLLSKSLGQNAYNWRTQHSRMTVLMKLESSVMAGKPGYHGYYVGEPYSVVTGLGGTRGAQNGATAVTTVTRGSRARITSVSVDYTPGGSY